MIRQEWKKLIHSKILMLVVIAVIAIPSVYTTLFLGSMWDPYGKADQLPVAVVNKDRPAVYGEEKLEIGKKLTEELKKDRSLDFRFTDEKAAQKWLANGDCYMVMTIPEDFSANAATLTQETPKKMEIFCETNPGTNYIASKMSGTAMKEIKSSVRKEVTKVYAQVLFDSMQKAEKGMKQASEGADSLEKGAEKVVDGNNVLTQNLDRLCDSTLMFQEGSETLAEGIRQYTGGLKEAEKGAVQLEENLVRLSGAYGDLSRGVSDLQNGTGKLKSGLQSVVGEEYGNSTSLAEGSRKISEGMKQISKVLNQTPDTAAISSLAAKLQGISQALGNTADFSNPSELKEKLENAQITGEVQALAEIAKEAVDAAEKNYQEGNNMAKQMRDAATALSSTAKLLENTAESLEGTQQLKTAAEMLRQQSEILAEGVQDYTEGVNAASDGSAILFNGMNTFQDSAEQIGQGIEAIKQGSGALTKGTQKLAEAALTMTPGAERLADGAGQIADGANALFEGSSSLGEGMGTIREGADILAKNLKEGTQKLGSINTGSSVVDMFAAPVDTKETEMTVMPNNGHAMAPYMMSVGLWVGCIAFSLMYPLNSFSGKLRSGREWWFSKASVLYFVAVAQAIVMVQALYLFDGFRPVRWGQTVLTACVASLAFMSVMYFFTSFLGKVGSFLMLIFMVVQLSGSAGTYPVEVSGDFVPLLHHFVPFTYTVKAFRSTISGGESVTGCLIFLAILFMAFSLLAAVQFRIRAAKLKKNKPLLSDWLEEHGLA